MYQIFGTERFLKTILYVNAAFAAALGSSLWGLVTIPYMRAVSFAVIGITTLLALFGQTPLFSWLCRLPQVWRWLPDLDGTYAVELQSNWPIVRDRGPDPTAQPKDLLVSKSGTVRITARLFTIRMELETADGYSSSHVVTAAVVRDPGERRPVLSYIFKAKVPVPEKTDSGEHFGAARLEIPLGPKITELTGSYWTNRNWHQGLNTAGRIQLIRQKRRRRT